MKIYPWPLAALLAVVNFNIFAADLRGQVKDAQGHPVAGAVVALNPTNGKSLVETTDEHGAFVFAEAADGSYGATATTPRQGAAFVPGIVLPRSESLDLRLSGAGPTIEGRVQSPGAAPVSRLVLSAARVSDASGDIFHAVVRDGRFALSLPAGRYVLFAKATGLSARSGIVDLSDKATIDLFLTREVGTNPSLAAELLRMEQRDQETRNRDLRDPAVRADIARLDRENGVRLRAILDEYRWPSADLVGYQAEQSAWLLLQHDGIELMPELLPELCKAAARGEIPKSSLALTIDRSRIASGQKQIYGSQFKQDAQGHWQALPIEDEDSVDARRREMGMEPLVDYRRRLETAYSKPGQDGNP